MKKISKYITACIVILSCLASIAHAAAEETYFVFQEDRHQSTCPLNTDATSPESASSVNVEKPPCKCERSVEGSDDSKMTGEAADTADAPSFASEDNEDVTTEDMNSNSFGQDVSALAMETFGDRNLQHIADKNVKILQCYLNIFLEKYAEGTNGLIEIRKLQEDGIFGNDTKQAVILFQQCNNLDANGIADENTKIKLYEKYRSSINTKNEGAG